MWPIASQSLIKYIYILTLETTYLYFSGNSVILHTKSPFLSHISSDYDAKYS